MVEKDEKQAVELYQKAADQGHLNSMFKLARCYENGTEVDRDGRETAHLYNVAVEFNARNWSDGEVDATSFTGTCFSDGTGIERDDVDGYKLTSQQGNSQHTSSKWRRVLLDDEVSSQLSTFNLPEDKTFHADRDMVPLGLIGKGQFALVYMSWLRSEKRYVAVKYVDINLPDKDVLLARNVVREQLACRVLVKEHVKNTAQYLGYTDLVRSGKRGLVFELCADISEVLKDAEAAKDDDNRSSHIPLEELPDWTMKVRSTLCSNVVFADSNRWNMTQKISMLQQAAQALLHVHNLGFIHRDIAPRNILCNAEGNVQLADFGLARYVGALNDDATLLARYRKEYFTQGHQYALAWWAPECFGSAEDGLDAVFSWNSDVYSFGMTMWQCFSHRNPFSKYAATAGKEQDVAKDIERLVVKGRRPSLIKLSGVDGDTPEKLIELIASCWHTDPEQRPAMPQVIATLDSIETYPKRKVGRSMHNFPPEKRHRVGFAAVPDAGQSDGVPYDVFLVHAGEQKLLEAETLKQILEEENLRCYLEQGTKVGSSSTKSTRWALRTCRYAVVILSKEFFIQEQPAAELKYAYDRVEWIRNQRLFQKWTSLQVILYNLTVKEYNEGCLGSSLLEELPKTLCNEVVVTEWKWNGKKTWSQECLELTAKLIQQDNKGAIGDWTKYLDETCKNAPSGIF